MIPRQQIISQVSGLSEDEIEAHFNLLPERYFVYTAPEDVALHLTMVNNLLQIIAQSESLGSLVPVIEWRDDLNLGMTVVHIVTWDRAGLFYKLAGSFATVGLSIVSSKALTRADHIAIDTFYVTEPNGGIVRDNQAKERFKQILEEALLQNRDLGESIARQTVAATKPSLLRQGARFAAPIPPQMDIYHELSLRRTIIEVKANDTIGLLFHVARVIYEHGFDITFARVATERNVAIDTFYIEPDSQEQANDPTSMLALRAELTEILKTMYPEVASTGT